MLRQAVESPVYLPAEPAIFEATKGYYQLIARLLAQDKIQLVPVRVFGDLESVGDGMKEMREGRVSALNVLSFVEDSYSARRSVASDSSSRSFEGVMVKAPKQYKMCICLLN